MRPSRLKAEGRPRRKRRQSVFACLTQEEWVALWKAQDGKCAICQTPLRNRYDPGTKEDDKIAQADHDHAIERNLIAVGVDAREALRRSMRGLLCYHDNRNVLHALRDSAARAYATGDYLVKPPAWDVLWPVKEAA